jgi:hypothetical protein
LVGTPAGRSARGLSPPYGFYFSAATAPAAPTFLVKPLPAK